MNKGQGPMSQMLSNIDSLVETGDTNWIGWFGSDKSKWPFDTECCATDSYFQMAVCDSSG